ncbi:MAG: acyl-CoA dehydrogenase family protein [Hyphomicrobiales bacterium]|nr:acyl-CoA dehydrogenase family protein [Hyphomicrobiales bacterium]
MTMTSAAKKTETGSETVVETAIRLAPSFAANAAAADDNDRFVAENYDALKAVGLLAAAVPVELGGRGAEIAELCDMIRTIGQACGSTALAFSMHTHQVAIPAWRWRHQKVAAVESLLKRVATERIVLLSSGGSDWIAGSGKAEKVEGGYRITARKVFTSGAQAGDILMTGAVLEGEGPAKVLHFGVPMRAPEVKVLDTWHTLGMRGTGSNDVVIDGLFIPDANVALARTSGEWHPLFQIISTIAFPLVYAAYLGVAESARDIAVALAKKKPANEHAVSLAGRMDTSLRAAQLAHRHMVATVEMNAPSAQSVNEVMMGRALVAEHAIKAVELALELGGGAGFYRSSGLERRFRDIQGARFHPLQQGPQATYAGSMALGLSVDKVF